MKKIFTLLLCVAGMCAVQVAKAATVDVATTNELKAALLLSEETTIRLTADMGMYQSSTKNFVGNKTIELNGHTLTAGYYTMRNTEATDHLTINGPGNWVAQGSYAFHICTGDAGYLTINGGTFTYSNTYAFFWFESGNTGAIHVTINGGTFHCTKTGARFTYHRNPAASVFEINGGEFYIRGQYDIFEFSSGNEGASLTFNGGSILNTYEWGDIALYGGTRKHIGAGKVLYINGVKYTDDFSAAGLLNGRLAQIGNSDDDFVTAAVTQGEGGKARFPLRSESYKTSYPSEIKVLKNSPLEIPVKAMPDNAYLFDNWSNISGTTLARTDTVDITFRAGSSNIAMKANFTVKPLHTINYTVSPGGSYSDKPDNAYQGQHISACLDFADGYLPVSLSVTSGGKPVDAYALDKRDEALGKWYFEYDMPDADVDVNAVVLPKRIITVEDAAHGTVTAAPTETWEGAEVTLTVTPDADYRIKSLTAISGVTPVAITNNKFIVPAGNVTVTPVFELIPDYTISIGSAVGGTVTSDPAGKSRPDSLVTLTIAEAPGYVLSSLTVKQGDDAVALSTVDALHRTFIMPEGNVTVTPTWEASVLFDITKVQTGTGVGTVGISQSSANVGREIIITATPDAFNYVESVTVKETVSGDPVVVTDNKFIMPAAAVTVTVKISPYEDRSVSTQGELKEALLLTAPAIVRLSADIFMFQDDAKKNFVGNKTIELNGHTLTAGFNVMRLTEATDHLTINGEGNWVVQGSYGFYVRTGDAGYLTINGGTFTYDNTYAFLWFGNDETGAAHIVINDGTFLCKKSGCRFIYHHSPAASTIEINGGEFYVSSTTSPVDFNGGAGADLTLNGGSFLISYDYGDIAFSGSAHTHLGTGKVMYVNGVKYTEDISAAGSLHGRLAQIGNSDEDFITATTSASAGGTARFPLRSTSYPGYYPSEIKVLKNCKLEIPVLATAAEGYLFDNWSDGGAALLARTDTVATTFHTDASNVTFLATFVTKTPTALDQTSQEPIANSQKLLINGQIFILRGDKTYTVDGREVK